MEGPPPRPPAIPEGAIWLEDANEWGLGAVDEQGRKQGLHRHWRPDGTLCSELHYQDGRGTGAYRRFHPNGEVARAGEMVAGELHGTVIAYACEAPTTERLQSCCVPENAWQLHLEYQHGQMTGQRWYDRAGIHILPSGKPVPVKPSSLPDDARYDDTIELWVSGRFNDEMKPTGLWRRWSVEGTLLEYEELDNGQRHGLCRRFQPNGDLHEEAHYAAGVRNGAYRNLLVAPGTYADERIVSEEGSFERNQAVGPWIFRDADGASLRELDLGVAVWEEKLTRSPALAPCPVGRTPQSANHFSQLCHGLQGERRIGEALLASARSAVAGGRVDPLREVLREAAVALSPDASARLAEEAITQAEGALAPVVNALVRGGDPPALLRALAASLRGADRIALDLLDAALLLGPERAECWITRALVNVHLGDPEAARADAHRLPEEWSEQTKFLLSYARVIFPSFDFWPAETELETLFQEVPEAPEQPLTAVQAQVQKYATRLMAIRDALRARVGQPGKELTWLPPDLSALLPAGPVPLGSWSFEEPGANEDGSPTGEMEEITVDERLVLDEHPVPSLLRLARQDWSALCWLCWSAGLDRVALPFELKPPASFGVAAGMSVERTWRCRDKLSTGGLRALTQRLPGFEWEGMEIDEMPGVLAEIATEQYVETRAVFYWLCDAQIRSPWQDDLRDNDG